MYKIQALLILTISLSVQSFALGDECRNKTINTELVVKCFRTLYFKEYDKLWDFLNKERERLAINGDKKSISEYLVIANAGGGNAEYMEYLNDFIENSIVKNTEEFMGSLLLLDKKTLASVFNILNQPIYASIQNLTDILEKYINLAEYKTIRNEMTATIVRYKKVLVRIEKARKKEAESW